MAKKKKEEVKIVLERTYNIPLRKEWLKVARYKRAKKAVKAVREFLIKHMKSTEIKVGKYLNLEIWKHGIKNPPHHIKVNATKDDKGLVKAEIVGAPKEKEPEEKKKEKKPKEGEKKEEKKEEKEVPKKKEKKETPKEETKKEEAPKEVKEEKPLEKESIKK